MYNNLKGEMAKKNITKTDISKVLGIHINTVSNKINGRSHFTVEEAFIIKNYFFKKDDLPLRYLFATDDDEKRVG